MNSCFLKNASGMQVEILDFGGIIRQILVPDRSGTPAGVTLGYADVSRYHDNPDFMGGIIGPVSGRTEDACFVIDGTTYRIPQNDGPHNLHSDSEHGFHKRTFSVQEKSDTRLVLSLHVPHLDLGFPGNRDVTVTYTLSDDNALRIDYQIESDRATFVNPTCHAYFNLDGTSGTDIHGHRARYLASRFLPRRADRIPTGEIRNVHNTPFDFTTEKEIGRDIGADDEQLRLANGYDHYFFIDGTEGLSKPFALVSSGVTGISMEVSSTLPGFQFYTGNYFSCEDDCTHRARGARSGFCVETGFPPNTMPPCDERNPFVASTVFRFLSLKGRTL